MCVHPQRLLKNINISVGARNLGEKDFEIMLGKGGGGNQAFILLAAVVR